MQQNPTDARLSFILKTYGKKYPSVVADMVHIIAATIGDDRWAQAIADASKDADPRFFEDFSKWVVANVQVRSREVTPQFAEALVAMVNERELFKRRHRADPIFPWIAGELAKPWKALRELGTSSDYYRAIPAPPAYAGLVNNTRRAGTSLALWYERTRPNLGEWQLDDALEEAKSWNEEHGEIPQGEVVLQMKDGWTAQKLTTQKQLSCEGETMQHCVASYGPDVMSGKTTIYSLRDAKGRPHVTIEVAGHRVQQTQGKQNERPDKKYQPYVDEFNEWLEEHDVDTNKIPKHLQGYAEVLEAAGDSPEDEHLVMFAEDWNQNTRSADEAKEWLDGGMSYSDAELVGYLSSDGVTPEEYGKFPYPVHHKIHEDGGVPRNLDELVKVARMAVKLGELADKRVEPELPSSAQEGLPFGDIDPHRVAERRPGHDAIGEKMVKKKWRDKPALAYPSIEFEEWEAPHYKDSDEDVRWLYPAEEWLAEGFKSDEDEEEYVGPWFLNYFTPEEAVDWMAESIVDGNLAAELRSYRLTPEKLHEAAERGVEVEAMFEEFDNLRARDRKLSLRKTLPDDAAKAAEQARLDRDEARYAKVIAKQIAESVDAAGVHRNKRTSKRRTSRSTR